MYRWWDSTNYNPRTKDRGLCSDSVSTTGNDHQQLPPTHSNVEFFLHLLNPKRILLPISMHLIFKVAGMRVISVSSSQSVMGQGSLLIQIIILVRGKLSSSSSSSEYQFNDQPEESIYRELLLRVGSIKAGRYLMGSLSTVCLSHSFFLSACKMMGDLLSRSTPYLLNAFISRISGHFTYIQSTCVISKVGA